MKAIDLSNVQEFTRFRNPVGGFICEIKTVEDVPEREFLRIGYDIAEAVSPDQQEFVGMYTRRKDSKGYEYPTTVISYKENSLPFFKGFITALEESNDGYKWDNDERKFVGLRIGFVIAEEEYEGRDKNGAPKVKVRSYVDQRRSVEAIKDGDFIVPEFKKLEQRTVSADINPFANNGATAGERRNDMPTFDVSEDDCPF